MVLFQLIEIIIIIISKTVKMNFTLFAFKFCWLATYVLLLVLSQCLTTSSIEMFYLCAVHVDTFIGFALQICLMYLKLLVPALSIHQIVLIWQ